MTAESPRQARRLDGWKEIAVYLNRDVRTVRRWEKDRGLPVHRLPGTRPGVYALVGEIDDWVKNDTSPPAATETASRSMTKGSGSFMIDHPLDPANKYLSHSFVESPDMMNVYNGIVRLDARGAAWVTLPDYLEALNGDFRYQLTAIGAPAPQLYIAREVSQNRFKIAGGRPGGRVSWQVTGIRHDAYANAHRIPVTEDKPAAEQGTYLHPDVYASTETRP